MAAGVRSKQADQKVFHDVHSRVRHFSVQSVIVRKFQDGPQWVPGVIVKILGPLSYVIQVRCGQKWNRHVDHIREGPSVQSGNLEAEIHDPLEEGDFVPPTSPIAAAETQIAVTRSNAATS